MKQILAATVLLLSSLFSYSQKQVYNNQSLLQENTSGLIAKSGLLNDYESSTITSDYAGYKDQYKKTSLSKIFGWSGAGLLTAGTIVYFVAQGFNGNTDESTELASYGLLGAGVVLEGLSIGFAISDKAKARKYSSTSRKYEERYSLNIGAAKHGVGLTLKF
jgi:hypothetical protein